MLRHVGIVGTGKPHIILVTEQWAGLQERFGLSNSNHNLCGSLAATGFATFEVVYIDRCAYRHAHHIDVCTLDAICNRRPDAVIIAPTGAADIDPSYGFVASLLELGVPLVYVWWDSIAHSDVVRDLAELGVAQVIIDTPMIPANSGLIFNGVPQDTRLYYPAEKTIDVCFLGTITQNRGARIECLEHLQACKPIYSQAETIVIGGSNIEPSKRLPVDQYADITRRAKIVLNFSGWGGWAQCKGRVFEALACEAMLLESKNALTAELFTEHRDYVSFTDKHDLVEKIRYYLQHDVERLAIATNGHKAYLSRYSPEHFWRSVFAAVGIAV